MHLCRWCEKRCKKSPKAPENGVESKEENGTTNGSNDEPSLKKQKLPVCFLCLGVLDAQLLDDVIEQSFRLLDEQDYEWKSLCFNLTAPVAVLPREAFFNTKNQELGCKQPGDLKDAWKSLLLSRLKDAGKADVSVVRNASDDDPTFVNIVVAYGYDEDDEECELVRKLDPAFGAKSKKVHGRKYDDRVLTRTYVQNVLNNAKEAQLVSNLSCLTDDVPAVKIARIELSRPSFWLAGRYLKFSRTLCQTPWFIDGKRKGETSLEELIQTGITEIIKCDSVRFSSSGREDVDVRCLGKGRPFLCQIVNPRKICNDASTAGKVKAAINAAGGTQISVRDVQFVTKAETGNLKEGEEEKIKCYRALCCTDVPVAKEKLDALADMKELVLSQKTPIRVLHRRSLAARDKVIHKMSVEICPGKDGRFFELSLETQAGTYIKEFVHGDLGRTTPNMTSILGVPTDIVALDVEAVKLDWPPCIDD